MVDCTTVFDNLKGYLLVNILEKAIDETGTDHRTKKFTALRQLWNFCTEGAAGTEVFLILQMGRL